MSKKLLALIILLILVFVAGSYYWLVQKGNPIPFTETEENPRGFNPFARRTVVPAPITNNEPANTTTNLPVTDEPVEIPALRLISATPVGGMMASSTASTTVLRYVDRGAGHIYESKTLESEIVKISNTTLPKIHESYWNRNLTAGVFRYLKEGTDTIVNFYAEIRAVNGTTSNQTNKTPYELKGKFLSSEIREIAVSPKGDKIFTFNIEGGKGVGYISQFDEGKKTKVWETPLTQISVAWPEENTIVLTTKASGASSGYVYALDPRSGSVRKVFGGVIGLTTKASADGRYFLFSNKNERGFNTLVYDSKDKKTFEVIIKTLPEKCVWSTLRKNEVFCAVPTEIPAGLYPDDWYKGTVSFIDQIWHLDTTTGEVRLLANLLNLSDKLIDATNLTLDPKEQFLFFINKNDLSLWSLDLNK